MKIAVLCDLWLAELLLSDRLIQPLCEADAMQAGQVLARRAGGIAAFGVMGCTLTTQEATADPFRERSWAAVMLASCASSSSADVELEAMHRYRWARSARDDRGALAKCLASRRDGCAAVDACLGATRRTPDGPTRCENNHALTWFGEATLDVDCSRRARLCVVVGALAECIEETGASCDPSLPSSRCEGDVVISCRGGREARGLACGELGLRCLDGRCAGASEDVCFAAGPNRESVEYVETRCDGRALNACVGGRAVNVDCATIVPGTSCQALGSEVYCGQGTECEPGKSPSATCEGAYVVQVCNGGKIDRVDCRALGFTRCRADGDHPLCE